MTLRGSGFWILAAAMVVSGACTAGDQGTVAGGGGVTGLAGLPAQRAPREPRGRTGSAATTGSAGAAGLAGNGRGRHDGRRRGRRRRRIPPVAVEAAAAGPRDEVERPLRRDEVAPPAAAPPAAARPARPAPGRQARVVAAAGALEHRAAGALARAAAAAWGRPAPGGGAGGAGPVHDRCTDPLRLEFVNGEATVSDDTRRATDEFPTLTCGGADAGPLQGGQIYYRFTARPGREYAFRVKRPHPMRRSCSTSFRPTPLAPSMRSKPRVEARA